jgi:hypothetical protein
MPLFTTSTDPIRTDFAFKAFPSGLALYTATYLHSERPFEALEELNIFEDTGFFGPIYVWPIPEQQTSPVPGLKSYHVSAYGRWKGDTPQVAKKLVTGTLYAYYLYEVQFQEGGIWKTRVGFQSVEQPIFLTQIYVTSVIPASQALPNQGSSDTVDFFFNNGENVKTLKPQYSYDNQNFATQEQAAEYVSQQNGGDPDLITNTSYVSLGRKLSDFFPGAPVLSPDYQGNKEVVEPSQNKMNISVNESNFGFYKEIEAVQSSVVRSGTITANLIYNFGHFSLTSSE